MLIQKYAKSDAVVVIKMSAYIHGCLFYVSVYYPDFTVCYFTSDS